MLNMSKSIKKSVEECISGRTPHLNALGKRLPDADAQTIYQLCMEIKTNRGNTIIHMGSRRGETDVIRQVLDKLSVTERVELLKQRNDWGRTALHHAAMQNREETLRMELEMVEPEKRFKLLRMQDQKGWTVLHRAAETGLFDIIQLLTNSLPQTDLLELHRIRNDDNCTAHDVALNSNCIMAAELLREQSQRLEDLSVHGLFPITNNSALIAQNSHGGVQRNESTDHMTQTIETIETRQEFEEKTSMQIENLKQMIAQLKAENSEIRAVYTKQCNLLSTLERIMGLVYEDHTSMFQEFKGEGASLNTKLGEVFQVLTSYENRQQNINTRHHEEINKLAAHVYKPGGFSEDQPHDSESSATMDSSDSD